MKERRGPLCPLSVMSQVLLLTVLHCIGQRVLDSSVKEKNEDEIECDLPGLSLGT